MFLGQFCIGWLIDGTFGFGGELFASVSDESGQEANNGDDMSKEFHGFKCEASAPLRVIFIFWFWWMSVKGCTTRPEGRAQCTRAERVCADHYFVLFSDSRVRGVATRQSSVVLISSAWLGGRDFDALWVIGIKLS